MNYLAERTGCIDASAIRKVMQLASSMKDPVNFSIGAPVHDPPEEMKKAAVEAILQGQNGYSLTAGYPPLQQALTDAIRKEFGWDGVSLIVTSGTSGSLTLSIMATVNPGDEVLIPDPYFVEYRHLVNLLGGKCVYIDTYPDFRLTPAKLESAITAKTKLLIFNSPVNPTGVVYTAAELSSLAAVLKKHSILVFSDEIYRELSFDGPAESLARFYTNSIVMRGFSKIYGAPGWRLGYAAAPGHLGNILDAMTTLQQYTFVCAPTPFQAAAVTSLNSDVSKIVAEYKVKRDLIYQGLKDHFELIKPAGAFYAFVKAPGGSGTEFVKKAIQNNVLVVPGSAFSEKDSHFRISYTTDNEHIRQGIERLVSLVKSF